MIKTINKKHISISFFQLNADEIPKNRRIFSISYSILKRSNSIDDLMNYILQRDEASIAKEVGKVFHASVAKEKIRINQEYEDRIDGTKAFLSPHTLSNTILTSKAFEASSTFKKIIKNNVIFEKKVILGIEINGLKMYLKGYLDICDDINSTIFELKTTNSIQNLELSIEKYEYNLQAYMYKMFSKICFEKEYKIMFIFITKFIPTICITKNTTENIISEGERKFNQYIEQLFNLITKHKLYNYFCLNIPPIL